MAKTVVLMVLIWMFLISCNDKQLVEIQAGCYFQREYVNYAWGFSHSGFTITSSGEVYTFNKSTPWVFPENGNISFASFKKNLDASVKSDTLISKSDIERFQQLAIGATSGKMSESVSVGTDMGSIITKIIIPDTDDPQSGYHEVNLTIDGDFSQTNLAPEATVIANWLSKLKVN